MTNAPLLAILTAIAVVPSTAADAMDQASLSVTATVVRPVAVPASIGRDAAAFTLGETAAVEVGASGATVSRSDGDRMVVTPDGSDRITITLLY